MLQITLILEYLTYLINNKNVYKFIQTIDHLSNSIKQLNKKAGYKFMHMTCLRLLLVRIQ
jgi:hypothetical protein